MKLSGDYLKTFNDAVTAARKGENKELSTKDGLIDLYVYGNLPIKLILVGFLMENITPKNATQNPIYTAFVVAAKKVGKNIKPGTPELAVSFIFEID